MYKGGHFWRKGRLKLLDKGRSSSVVAIVQEETMEVGVSMCVPEEAEERGPPLCIAVGAQGIWSATDWCIQRCGGVAEGWSFVGCEDEEEDRR